MTRPGFVAALHREPADVRKSANGLVYSAASNLPLAARLRVGHIRLNGAVAEWLKAAVC